MRRLLTPAIAALLGLALLAAAPAATGEDEEPRGAISGTVGPYDANVRVVVESLDHPGSWREEDSDEDSYTIDWLQPGRYRVAFTSRFGGYSYEYFPGTSRLSQARVVTVRSGRTTTGVDASLERTAGTIRGTVAFSRREAVANRPPRMVPYYLDGSTWRPVPRRIVDGVIGAAPFSSAPPTYELYGLPPGTYALRYQTSQGHDGTASGFLGGSDDPASATAVRVKTAEVTAADITPRRGGTLAGRVVDSSGRPLPGVEVTAYTREDDEEGSGWHSRNNTVTTGVDGRYEIFPVDPEAQYLVLVPPAGYDMSFSGGVQRDARFPYDVPSVPEGTVPVRSEAARVVEAPEEVVLAAGRLEGIVRDSVDGSGVPGMTVTARRLDAVRPGRGYTMSATVEAVTDARGRYSLGQVGQGYYELRAKDPQGVYSDEIYVGEDSVLPIDTYHLHGMARVRSERTTTADFASYPSRPGLSDETPVVGQTIVAEDPRASGGPDAAWTWRRDGVVVPDQDGETYEVGADDRGARLTAEVLGDRAGRDVVHRSTGTKAVTAARPTVSVSARSTPRGRVVLTIRAEADGVPVDLVDGRVEVGRVRKGSDRLTTRTMVDGALTVTLTGQPRGRRTYTARFLTVPDRFTASTTAKRSVTVR